MFLKLLDIAQSVVEKRSLCFEHVRNQISKLRILSERNKIPLAFCGEIVHTVGNGSKIFPQFNPDYPSNLKADFVKRRFKTVRISQSILTI